MEQQNVSVTTPAMQQACSLFETTASTMTQQMQSVNDCQSVLQSSWTGDASLRFNSAMNEWEQEFDVIIKELVKMIGVMGGAAKVYAQNEEQAVTAAPQWAQNILGLANF
jgi:WXG100 family type VII secretion target